MKKINLIASILISFLSCKIVFAQTIPEGKFTKPNLPVFLVNGFVNFSAASRNQATIFEQEILPNGITDNRLSNAQGAGNDSQFFFKSGIMTENKDKYGAVAKVEFNVNSDRKNEMPNLDQAFIYSQNSFGKFELGNNQAVNQKMKSGPAHFARGAGGINGKYLENVNMPMLANSPTTVCLGTNCANVKLPSFIMLAQSPIGHGGGARSFYNNSADSVQNDFNSFNRSNFRALKDDSFDGVEDATKINYYSPRIAGLQLGISYAPDSADSGITSTKYYNVNGIRIKNIMSFGVNYSEDFDNLGVEISATAERGKMQNSQSSIGVERSDLAAYDLGATFSYFGFNFGASYGSWGKSMQPKNGIYSCDYNSSETLLLQTCATNVKKFQDPHYYTAGISYAFGPIATSITGIKSKFQENSYEAISLGVDYKLSRALMPYVEITKFAFKSNQPKSSDIINQYAIPSNQRQIKNNQGYILLTGILISF